jgi:COMM domain
MDAVHGETTWAHRLQKISWRIDTKTKTRRVEEMNELSAIVELVVGNGITPTRDSEVVRFEMNAEELSAMAARIEAIQASIEGLAQ